METNPENKRLLEEFAPHTYEEWKQAAIELLKGRPFEKTLITPTYEGFPMEPIYVAEGMAQLPHMSGMPGMGNLVRGSQVSGYLQGGWKISQELSAPDPKSLNGQILEGLDGGQNEVNLWLDAPTRAGIEIGTAGVDGNGICGLSLQGVADLKALLAGVHTEMISIYVRGGAVAPELYGLVQAWAAEAGIDAKHLNGCIGYDPIGWLIERGELPGGMEAAYDRMAKVLKHAAASGSKLQVIEIQGHACHNGGGSSCQELAMILASGFQYLKAMVELGIDAATVAAHTRLSVSIGANYFLEISKLRALRLLWSRLLEAFGVAEESRAAHVHARTGLFNKTLFDPYVNMLRTTTEAFSAVVGGCDSLHIGPFDEILRESDPFSRRIARNTHTILAEECGMSEVIDPAGGSWAVETLTDKVARKSWSLFQEIEASGGILAAIESGKLQADVEAVRQQRAANIHQRRDVIVGTNTYPNAKEELLVGARIDYGAAKRGRIADLEALHAGRDAGAVESALAAVSNSGTVESLIAAAAAGATVSELYQAGVERNTGITVEPIRLRRAAEDYEALRMAASALAQQGKPAKLLQLNVGPSRRYRARADWTSGFFQVGGFTVMNETDFDGADDALAAIAASGARVAVITSDDETYAASVEDMAVRIKSAHPALKLIVAGAPGETEAAWRAAGVDDFVHVRVNNYRFNRQLLESLGAQL